MKSGIALPMLTADLGYRFQPYVGDCRWRPNYNQDRIAENHWSAQPILAGEVRE